jgi:hypothetical protein
MVPKFCSYWNRDVAASVAERLQPIDPVCEPDIRLITGKPVTSGDDDALQAWRDAAAQAPREPA